MRGGIEAEVERGGMQGSQWAIESSPRSRILDQARKETSDKLYSAFFPSIAILVYLSAGTISHRCENSICPEISLSCSFPRTTTRTYVAT